MGICHSHVSHNAPYLPPTPQILRNLCFSFLLGITAVPRDIDNTRDNTYAKFWGAKKVHYGRWASGVFIYGMSFTACDKVLGRIGCTCNTADINCHVVFSWDQEYISVAKGAAYPRYRRIWQRKHICIEGILEPEAFFFCPFTIKSCKLQHSKLHFGFKILRNIQHHLQGVTEEVWFGWSNDRISFRVALEYLNDSCIVVVAIFYASRNFMLDEWEIFDFWLPDIFQQLPVCLKIKSSLTGPWLVPDWRHEGPSKTKDPSPLFHAPVFLLLIFFCLFQFVSYFNNE